ncbi:MAG: hypothetical protein KQI62_01985 [Deltaproteobacteria bacterium]|nr:hypothetical protein [Deltaproteobacteria bacterium]
MVRQVNTKPCKAFGAVLLVALFALSGCNGEDQGAAGPKPAPGTYAAAVAQAKENPGPGTMYRLGVAQEKAGKLAEAIHSYRMVADTYKDEKYSPMASARIAVVYYRLGGIDSSRKWLELTQKRYPGFKDVDLMEVEIRLTKDLDKSSKLLEAYLQMPGANLVFGYQSAADCMLAMAQNKNWDKKLLRASYGLWLNAIRYNPKSARDQAMAGRVLYRITGVSKQVVEHFQAAVKLSTGKEKVVYQKELNALVEQYNKEKSIAFSRSKINEIEAKLDTVITPEERSELIEQEAKYRFNLGVALMGMGRYGLAEHEFTQATSMVPRNNPNHVYSLVYLAKIKMSSSRITEIKEAVDLAYQAADTPGFEDNAMVNQALDQATARFCSVRPQCKQIIESSILGQVSSKGPKGKERSK